MKDRLDRVVRLWIDLFAEHAILDHASAIAFQVLKALIPMTLLGLGLLGALGQERVWNRTLGPGIKSHVQPATFHAIDAAVQKIFTTEATGLIVFASVLATWYISGTVRAVMTGMNGIYEADETRSWRVRYAISLALAMGIAVCVIGSVIVVSAGAQLADRGALAVVVGIGRWLVAVGALGLAVALLVRWAPAERRSKRWASAGSALVIAAWIVASLLFKLFVSDIANFKTATGSLTVFLVLISYVYTSSIIFLVGVQLDELLRQDATRGERGVLELLFSR
jgi:membrane protein